MIRRAQRSMLTARHSQPSVIQKILRYIEAMTAGGCRSLCLRSDNLGATFAH